MSLEKRDFTDEKRSEHAALYDALRITPLENIPRNSIYKLQEAIIKLKREGRLTTADQDGNSIKMREITRSVYEALCENLKLNPEKRSESIDAIMKEYGHTDDSGPVFPILNKSKEEIEELL